jgi:hypothetical protein
MNVVSCCRCIKPYRLTSGKHKAFCDSCLSAIHSDAAEAERHLQRINAGDMHEVPATERERITRDDARRRQLNPATRDINRPRKLP